MYLVMWEQREQVVDTTLTYNQLVNMATILANSCLFTQPTDTEQHQHSYGVVFVLT